MSCESITFKIFVNGNFLSLSTYNFRFCDLKRHLIIKRKKDCDEKNEQKPFDCIYRFISSLTNCNVPFSSPNFRVEGLRNCSTIQDLDTFYVIWKDILNKKHEENLKDYGCLLQNCEQNVWIAKPIATFDENQSKNLENQPSYSSFIKPNKTTFFFTSFSKEVILHKTICIKKETT